MDKKQRSSIKNRVKVPISFCSVLGKMRQRGAYSAWIEGGGMEIVVNSRTRRVGVQGRMMLPIGVDYSGRAVNYYLDRMRLESLDKNCVITYHLPPKNQI